MKAYIVLCFGAMVLPSITGCVGGDPGSIVGTGGAPCETGGSGGSGGFGGSSVQCAKPKQIRLLEAVTTTGIEIEVTYDSLDRREPRVTEQKLPTTELEPGDLVDMDPIDKVHRETVLVTDVGIFHDMDWNKYYRTFTGVFTKPHILNAPGTTPIKDGCPAFAMPIQEVCDEHGKVIEVQSSCWNRICMYGEWVLSIKPEASACGYTFDGIMYMKGKCNYEGGCLP